MTNTKNEYGFGNGPVVIRKHVDDIKGGVMLDVTGWEKDFVPAGHIIIRDTETQKVYKPFPVANGALGSLPEGYEYCGVLIASVPKDEPMAAVLTIGEVNDKALKFPLTTAIKTAFKAAMPTIIWNHD